MPFSVGMCQETVEHTTLEWVHWFNNNRMLKPIAMCRRQSSRWRIILSRNPRPRGLDSHKMHSAKSVAVHFSIIPKR
jgi:hypothetical protein